MSEENRIVTQMYQKIMEARYPAPDPDWEYSEIYHRVQEVRQSMEKLIAFMNAIEQPTPETDKSIREYLDQIGNHLNQTRRMLDE